MTHSRQFRQHGRTATVIAALLACPMFAASTASAQSVEAAASEPPAASWYVVGDVGRDGPRDLAGIEGFAGFDDRLVAGDVINRPVALGLTFSNAEADRTLDFTAPSPVLDRDNEDRFTFLVSGAYDWHTGTIVTPRFMAGVGVSYLAPNAPQTRLRQDAGQGSDVTPTMQVGIGADVAVSSALDLSAEYRASVRGGTEAGDTEREAQVDQKFMLGAKIRF